MKRMTLVILLSSTIGSAFAATDWTFTVSPTHRTYAKGLHRTFESILAMQAFKKRSFLTTTATIPNSYSLQNLASQVENQGSCGSCWDFSLTGTLRDTYITTGKKDPGRLSFNYLLYCATDQSGCNGGDFNAAQYFVTPKGAPSWDTSPYSEAGDGSCIVGTPIASTASYTMLGENGNVSFKDIAYAVGVQHLPVSIDVAAEGSFMNYSSGVYNACDNNSIDHMVIIEGYDCEGACNFDSSGNLPAGQGTFLVKNSWGSDWGQSGYITMKATDSSGSKCNAVATDALIYTLGN
jgi:C1A family cysteine protease